MTLHAHTHYHWDLLLSVSGITPRLEMEAYRKLAQFFFLAVKPLVDASKYL